MTSLLSARALLSCPLCHGDISVRAGDLKKVRVNFPCIPTNCPSPAQVVAHLEDCHGVFHDVNTLLAMAFLEVHEKEVRSNDNTCPRPFIKCQKLNFKD